MNAFGNLKVGVKILSGFMIALALMVVVGGVAMWRLAEVNTTVANLTGNLSVDRQLGNDLVTQILLARFYANKFTTGHAPADLERFSQEFGTLTELLQRGDVEITQVDRVALLQAIETDAAAYHAAFDTMVTSIQERDQVQADELDVQGPLAEEKLRALRASAYQAADLDALQAAGDAQAALVLMRLNSYKYLAAGDPQMIAKFDERYAEAQAAFARLDADLQDAGRRRLMEEARAALEAYNTGFKALEADFNEQRRLQTEQLDVLGPQVREDASAIVASVGTDFDASAQATNDLVQQTQVVLITVMVVAAVIGIGLGLVIANSITRPLNGVMQAAQQMAEVDLNTLAQEMSALADGDLTRRMQVQAQPLSVHSTDEVGRTAQAVNTIIARLQEVGQAFAVMSSNLRRAVSEVAENANQVSSASGQLAAAATQAGQATNQIATTVAQVAKGTQQQSESVTKTA
ncbi:MAG: HAMP domain-containing protein, partial [Anaerolineales bacterium]|nr:HAMP domain-containing protein [Anaerolineales bacterium]